MATDFDSLIAKGRQLMQQQATAPSSANFGAPPRAAISSEFQLPVSGAQRLQSFSAIAVPSLPVGTQATMPCICARSLTPLTFLQGPSAPSPAASPVSAQAAGSHGDVDVDGFLKRFHAAIAYNAMEDARASALLTSLGTSQSVRAAQWHDWRSDVRQSLRQAEGAGNATGKAWPLGAGAVAGSAASAARPGTTGAAPVSTIRPLASQAAPQPANGAYTATLAEAVATIAAEACPPPGPITLLGSVCQAGHERDDPTSAVSSDGELSRRTRQWTLLSLVAGEGGDGPFPTQGAYGTAWGLPSPPTSLGEALSWEALLSSARGPTREAGDAWAGAALRYLGDYHSFRLASTLDTPPLAMPSLVQAFLQSLAKSTVQSWWRTSVRAAADSAGVPLFPQLYHLLRAGAWMDAAEVAGKLPKDPSSPVGSPHPVAIAMRAYCTVVAEGEGQAVDGAGGQGLGSSSLGTSALNMSGSSSTTGAAGRRRASERLMGEVPGLASAVARAGQEWQAVRGDIVAAAQAGQDPWETVCPYRAAVLCLLVGPSGDPSLPLSHPLALYLHGHPMDWAWHRLWHVATADLTASLSGQGQGQDQANALSSSSSSLASSVLRMSHLGSSQAGMPTASPWAGQAWARYCLQDAAGEAWALCQADTDGAGGSMTPLALSLSPGLHVYRTAECLLLLGLPEAAVAHLALHGAKDCPGKHAADAVHLALGLAYYGLLRSFPARLALAQTPGQGPPAGVSEVRGMGSLLYALGPSQGQASGMPVHVLDLVSLVGGYLDSLGMGPLVRLDYGAALPPGVVREALLAQLLADTVTGPGQGQVSVRALASRLRTHGVSPTSYHPVPSSLESEACRVLGAAGELARDAGDTAGAVELASAAQDYGAARAALVPALASLASLPYSGQGKPAASPQALAYRQRLLALALIVAESAPAQGLQVSGIGAATGDRAGDLPAVLALCSFYDRLSAGDASAAVTAAYSGGLVPSVQAPSSGPSSLASSIVGGIGSLLGSFVGASTAATSAEEEWSSVFDPLPSCLKAVYGPFMMALAQALLQQYQGLVKAAGSASAAGPAAGLIKARLSSLHTRLSPSMGPYVRVPLPQGAVPGAAQGMSVVDVIAASAAAL